MKGNSKKLQSRKYKLKCAAERKTNGGNPSLERRNYSEEDNEVLMFEVL